MEKNILNYDNLRKEDDLGEKTNTIVTLDQTEYLNLITKYSKLLRRITFVLCDWKHCIIAPIRKRRYKRTGAIITVIELEIMRTKIKQISTIDIFRKRNKPLKNR